MRYLGLILLALAVVGCGDNSPGGQGFQTILPDTGEDAAGDDVREEDAAADLPEPDSSPDVESDPGPDIADATPEDATDASDLPDTPEDSGGDVEDAGPDVADVMDADVADVPDVPDVPEGVGPTCFAEIWDDEQPGPDYDQFMPEVGEHCQGTNYQDIQDVEQLIFLGDSVTQGTPNDDHLLCVDNEHFYRNLLADWTADHFGLDKGDLIPYGQWRSYSCLYNGEPGLQNSGDLHNCSKWGARTDDFLGDTSCGGYEGDEHTRCCEVCCAGGVCNENGSCIRAANAPADDDLCGRPTGKQVYKCFPDGGTPRTSLFVFTMGGNDIAKITQEGALIDPETPEGAAEIEAGYPTIWALAERTVAYLEQAIAFLKDPDRFPNGSYVIFANPFEFTDGTGMTSACSPDSINIPGIGELDVSELGLNLAELAGFGEWAEPEVQAEIVIWVLEQFMRIADQYGADMIWMLEHFCGHGYVATGPEADTENRCYREDNPTRWFDITCIHPNAAGHEAIYRMFRAVIEE